MLIYLFINMKQDKIFAFQIIIKQNIELADRINQK